MKQLFCLAALLLLLSSCSRSKNQLSGLWKISKVEIHKNNQLKKVIDTGNQYWSFDKRSTIQIYDKQNLQNTLQIKCCKQLIKSLDTSTGLVKEEFVIQKINHQHLSLSSHKKIEQDDYNVIYYLHKVPDSLHMIQ